MKGRRRISETYYLIGAGGHAKVVLDALLSSGKNVGGCYDSNPALTGREVLAGIRVLGNLDDAERDIGIADLCVIAIGENRVRRKLDGCPGVTYGKVISTSAVIGGGVEICEGTMILPSATINVDSRIGRQVILNTSCSVDHDCVIGDYAHLAPGCALGGNVMVGEGSFLGVGVRVIPGVRIGRWSVIGAGAVVTKDLPDNCTAVGVPAKIIKTREEGWHLA